MKSPFAPAFLALSLTLMASAVAGSAQAAEPIARLTQATKNVSQVEIFENGTAVFTIHALNAETHTLTLKPATLAQIQSLVQALSNAEIVTSHHAIVCMMMPFGPQSTLFVSSSYDFLSGQFGTELKEALNPQGCWNSTQVAPKEAYAMQDAQSLEAILRVLANELAE